jgi:hypothetical protein
MPQIAKGGKYIFGWTRVKKGGEVLIPPEAYEEYDFTQKTKVILIQGSKTSGGFCLTTVERLQKTRLKNVLDVLQYSGETGELGAPASELHMYMKKGISWTHLDERGVFILADKVMEYYDISVGSVLLTGRGSDTGLAFIVRGGIYQAARHYQGEIKIF